MTWKAENHPFPDRAGGPPCQAEILRTCTVPGTLLLMRGQLELSSHMGYTCYCSKKSIVFHWAKRAPCYTFPQLWRQCYILGQKRSFVPRGLLDKELRAVYCENTLCAALHSGWNASSTVQTEQAMTDGHLPGHRGSR